MRISDQLLGKLNHRRIAWQNWRHISALTAQVKAHAAPVEDRRPVVFFNASTRIEDLSLNAAFNLLASKALELQGVPVVHFVCQGGMKPCVLGTHANDPQHEPPCQRCIHTSHRMYAGTDVRWFGWQPEPDLEAKLAGLGIEALAGFTYQGIALGALTLPSLRWILRRHHLIDDENTRLLHSQYILSAWNLAREFNRFLDEAEPRSVVVFNGISYSEAVVKTLAKQRKLKVFTHEVALRPFTAFFTDGEATAYPINIPQDFRMNPDQDQRLDEYLQQRFKGNFSMAGIQFWPEMKPLDPEFLEKAKTFQQIVPVFTNVIFDTSQAYANTLFLHMFAWLDAVLELARAHPETLFVLRAHPDEERPGKEARESVAGWVRESRATDLPNLVFVGSSEYLSSYELIQRSKFVMVYNSTIGMEATLLGAAVLCAGRARYTQIPTVFFPPDRKEYDRLVEEMLNADTIEVPEVFRQNARRFLYYQLYRSSLPFNDMVENEGLRRGYVKMKRLSWQKLLPENSDAIKAILDGILCGGNFLLEE